MILLYSFFVVTNQFLLLLPIHTPPLFLRFLLIPNVSRTAKLPPCLDSYGKIFLFLLFSNHHANQTQFLGLAEHFTRSTESPKTRKPAPQLSFQGMDIQNKLFSILFALFTLHRIYSKIIMCESNKHFALSLTLCFKNKTLCFTIETKNAVRHLTGQRFSISLLNKNVQKKQTLLLLCLLMVFLAFAQKGRRVHIQALRRSAHTGLILAGTLYVLFFNPF